MLTSYITIVQLWKPEIDIATILLSNIKNVFRDFPGGPVVKTSPSNAGSDIVTNSIKTLKMVHIKKKRKKRMYFSFANCPTKVFFSDQDPIQEPILHLIVIFS